MRTIHWLRETTEYVIGAALVLTHLALAGRGLSLPEALREPRP